MRLKQLSNKLKKAAIFANAIAFFIFTAHSTANTAEEYEALSKDLTIMSGIFGQSLKDVNEAQKINVRGIEGQYLAGQGFVFNVDTSARRMITFSVLDPLAPPPPPKLIGVNSINLTSPPKPVEMEKALEDMLNEFEIIVDGNRDTLRRKQGEIRVLSRNLRDLARTKNDLEFQLQSVDETKKQEIKAKLEMLTSRSEEFELKQQKIEEAANTLQEKMKKKAQEQRAAFLKMKNSFLSAFEKNIADSLCRFGAGIRALPKDEHITFVLEGINSKLTSKQPNRIYVFKAANVKRCVQEKIKVSDLLTSATTYNF